jgi:hypothetical protein
MEDKPTWGAMAEEEELARSVSGVSIPKVQPIDEDCKNSVNSSNFIAPLDLIKPTVEDLNEGVQVIVSQDDPTSPLSSAHTFEELNL